MVMTSGVRLSASTTTTTMETKLIGYYNTRTKQFIPIDQYQRINREHGFKPKAVEHIIELHDGGEPADIKTDTRAE